MQIAKKHMKRCSILLIIRDANQNHNDVLPYTGRMDIIKKPTNDKCWRGSGVKGTSYTTGGNANWFNCYGGY